MRAATAMELAVFAVFGLIAVFGWRRVWSGSMDETLDRGLRPLWPYGEHSRKGFTRTFPMALAALFAGAVMIILHAPIVVERAPAVAVVSEWLGGAIVLPASLMLYTIIAYNRPRLIVAPHRRGEAGAVEAWRAERRERGRRETR